MSKMAVGTDLVAALITAACVQRQPNRHTQERAKVRTKKRARARHTQKHILARHPPTCPDIVRNLERSWVATEVAGGQGSVAARCSCRRGCWAPTELPASGIFRRKSRFGLQEKDWFPSAHVTSNSRAGKIILEKKPDEGSESPEGSLAKRVRVTCDKFP